MTIDDLNPKRHPLNNIQLSNLTKLANAMTELEDAYGKPFMVTSGFRTEMEQLSINPGHPNSAHRAGCAVDINDPYKDIWGWLMENIDYPIRFGLFLESKATTPRHVHIQITPPRSGTRIFNP